MYRREWDCVMIQEGGKNYRYSSRGPVVVIGDLHGHYPGLVSILRHTGLVGEDLRWSGGEATLVQIGDLFGRGDEGKHCCELLMNLETQASEFGGRVITLLGNHEAMATHFHLRYITTAEMANFVTAPPERQDPQTAFIEAVSNASALGRWLRTRPAAVMVNDDLFVHGGLEWDWARMGMAWINSQVHEDMAEEVVYRSLGPTSPLTSRTGPLWNRRLITSASSSGAGEDIEMTLAALDARSMIVGHTPSQTVTEDGQRMIVSKYGGRLIGVDVGIHPLFGGTYGWLEIDGDRMVGRSMPSPHQAELEPLPPDLMDELTV
ncbi:MAG: hypothetical protein GXY33_03205 [Phycisphaerae bacterium]|nr:hypothetical protein [Phycisphaerae bacterium]